jgi:hypothetical protein
MLQCCHFLCKIKTAGHKIFQAPILRTLQNFAIIVLR